MSRLSIHFMERVIVMLIGTPSACDYAHLRVLQRARRYISTEGSYFLHWVIGINGAKSIGVAPGKLMRDVGVLARGFF